MQIEQIKIPIQAHFGQLDKMQGFSDPEVREGDVVMAILCMPMTLHGCGCGCPGLVKCAAYVSTSHGLLSLCTMADFSHTYPQYATVPTTTMPDHLPTRLPHQPTRLPHLPCRLPRPQPPRSRLQAGPLSCTCTRVLATASSMRWCQRAWPSSSVSGRPSGPHSTACMGIAGCMHGTHGGGVYGCGVWSGRVRGHVTTCLQQLVSTIRA